MVDMTSPRPIRDSRPVSALRGIAKGLKTGRVTSAILGDSQKGPAATGLKGLFGQYQPLAYKLPWEILDYVELLATYNPDYSQAVENIKMLANTGHTLLVDAGSDLKQRRIKTMLESKARIIQETHGGIDGVISKLMDQAATFGAMCGEWVLNDELTEVIDFADISPKKIRYFWDEDEQRFLPYQKVTTKQAEEAEKSGQKRIGDCVLLNELTFRYYAFDAAPESPYGTPPFLAALVNIGIQRDLINNMAQIVKKIGLLGIIDLTIERLESKPGETPEQYTARASQYLEEYVEVAEEMVKEGGLIHYDDVKANTWAIGGNAAGATNIHKANEELVFSGLKSMPSVQGRCLDPSTRILMANGSSKPLSNVDVGDFIQGFDEHTSKSRRRWRIAKVENVWSVQKESLRIYLSDGRSVLCSEDHPFLMQVQRSGKNIEVGWERLRSDSSHRSKVSREAALARWTGQSDELAHTDWKRAKDIRVGEWIKAINEPLEVNYLSDDYRAGYVAGAANGDGCWRGHTKDRRPYWQLAVQKNDDVIIDRCEIYAHSLGLPDPIMSRFVREPNANPNGVSFVGTQPMSVLKTCRKANVKFLASLDRHRDSVDYRAGWLSGIYDTDGSRHLRERNREQVRFCQSDGPIKDRIEKYLSDLGFTTTRHRGWIEVVGDRLERWRLVASINPALDRKVVNINETTVRTFKPVRVERIKRAGVKSLIDITTTTSTFVGNGLLTHNSYSTTETYAGVAYEIIIRNTAQYQRACRRIIESGYWLMCALAGDQPDKIRLVFNENRTLNRLQDAQAQRVEISNSFMLWLLGIIDQVGLAQRHGFNEPKTPMEEPPAELASTIIKMPESPGKSGFSENGDEHERIEDGDGEEREDD